MHHDHYDHHHNYEHDEHSFHNHHDFKNNKKGLYISILITVVIMLLEFFGGLFSNSLALLSDSVHMLSDVASLFLVLLALHFSQKSANSKYSYGFHRIEILSALFNGITLFFISFYIFYESFNRLLSPQNVSSVSVIVIAFIGLFANLISAYLLMKQSDVKNNINIRSAYFHILSDALGAFGAIIAGFSIYFFKRYMADSIISVIVALLILKGAWQIIRQSLHILMEGVPNNIDYKKVNDSLMKIKGVKEIHNLRIWNVSSKASTLNCHILIDYGYDCQIILKEVIQLLNNDFKIEDNTIQIRIDNLK
jgi:cobalt-zinc-cadmium efflux system protein